MVLGASDHDYITACQLTRADLKMLNYLLYIFIRIHSVKVNFNAHSSRLSSLNTNISHQTLPVW